MQGTQPTFHWNFRAFLLRSPHSRFQDAMPVSYIDTYYRRTILDHPAYPMLSDARQVDVCIVGGGLAGLSTAVECQQRGLKVAVLEQHRIAWGASGRNGGFVTAGFATGHAQIARRTGEADAK